MNKTESDESIRKNNKRLSYLEKGLKKNKGIKIEKSLLARKACANTNHLIKHNYNIIPIFGLNFLIAISSVSLLLFLFVNATAA